MTYVEALNNSVIVDAVAKLASIAGLFFTIYAVYRIAEIRRSFLLRARLPALKVDLRRRVDELNRALRDFDHSRHHVLEELSMCSSTLRGIARVSVGTSKAVVRTTQRTVKRYKRHQTEETARHVYVALRELEEELKNLAADTLWR